MKKYAVIFLGIIGALVLAQCSKRSNPVDTTISQHGRYWNVRFESNAIKNDKMVDYWWRQILVYTPPGYDLGDTLRGVPTDSVFTPQETTMVGDSMIITPPDTQIVYGDTLPGTYYPVLYLLHGYGGDQDYFSGWYNLANVMDELISSGQIKPMIVAMPNATNNLGGSFYTNSNEPGTGANYAGQMQDFVTNEVVHVVDSLFNSIKDRNHRGIAGHSMGGYGAVKLAMLRNDMFGSAASMSGPLAFWGQQPQDSAFEGLVSLMPAMFEENNFNPLDATTNTERFYQIGPASGKRLTNMMFAMASAFSPHDPTDADTSYMHRFTTGQFTGALDLPFDVNGQLAVSVWQRWMANDITALAAAGYGGVFDSTDLYVDAGMQDDLYLQYQAQVFDHVISAIPHRTYQYEIYPGAAGFFAADHMTMIAERLKKVMIFENASFNR